MIRIVLALLLAFAATAQIPGTFRVTGPVAPPATNSNFGATLPVYGYGGLLTGLSSLSQLQDTNRYPVARRHAGQIARLTTGAEYTLGSDLTSWYNSGSVSNMAQLRSIEPATVGGVVTVDAYSTSGDDGGGIYTLKSSTTGTNSFGGKVLALGGAMSWSINGETISPKQFGCLGDGTVSADQTARLQACVDYAYQSGAAVILPKGTWTSEWAINVWSGVRLLSFDGAILQRWGFMVGNPATGAFNFTNRFLLHLWGSNVISGITIDGNARSTNVSVFGDPDMSPTYFWMNTNGVINQTQYGDLAVGNGRNYTTGPSGTNALADALDTPGAIGTQPVYIQNCIFKNSAGSHIKNLEEGARSVYVLNNEFYDYYDHSVYFIGWPDYLGWNTPARNILVDGNSFKYPDMTRGNTAIKLRNYCSDVVYSNNKLDLIDTAFALDVQESVYGLGPLERIIITGNSGKCRDLLTFAVDQSVTNSHDVVVSANDITYTRYVASNNALPQGPSGNLTFVGNNFTTATNATAGLFVLSGTTNATVNPTVYLVSDNHFIGTTVLSPYGRVRPVVQRNTAVDMRAPGTANNNFFAFVSGVNNHLNTLLDGSTATAEWWDISDNVLINYAALIFDNMDQNVSGTNFLGAANIVLSGNTIFGHPTRGHLIDIRGTNASGYTGTNKVYFGRNTVNTSLGAGNTLVSSAIKYIGGSSQSTDFTLTYPSVTVRPWSGQANFNVSRAAGQNADYVIQTDGVSRWIMRGNNTAESGSNAGSDWSLIARDDAGASLSQPIFAKRSTGRVGVANQTNPQYELDVLGDFRTGKTTAADAYLRLYGNAGQLRRFLIETGTTARWGVLVDNVAESGSDAGSDFSIGRFNDAGTLSGQPLGITRSNGKVRLGENGLPLTRIRQGTVALTGGTATVAEVWTTANSNIQLTSQVDGGTPGNLRVSARSAGVSFTITSSSGTDTSTVGWIMFEP